MQKLLITIAVVGATALPSLAADKPPVAALRPPAATEPVVAAKPAVPSSPAIGFAERDVAHLKSLAAKNKKLAPKLAKAEARLKRLRNDKSPGKPEPKNMTLLESFTHNRPMISCRFDGTGRYVFAGAMDNALHRIDTIGGERTNFPGHESWIRRFDLHPETGKLLTGSYAGRLMWWNPMDKAPKPLRKVDAHKGYVRGIAFSPDGKLVATGGNDNMVRVWSTTDGRLIRELRGHARHVYNVRFDPAGKYLVSGDLMGVLKQWDVATWKHVRDLDAKVLTKYDKTFRADCGGIPGHGFQPQREVPRCLRDWQSHERVRRRRRADGGVVRFQDRQAAQGHASREKLPRDVLEREMAPLGGILRWRGRR